MNREQDIGALVSLIGAGLAALLIAWAYSSTDMKAGDHWLGVGCYCFGFAVGRAAWAGIRSMIEGREK